MCDEKEVFPICSDDLGFGNKMVYTILTTTEKPVCLPHWIIHHQSQEVRKCFDIWLGQGVMGQLKCSYASHLVNAKEKTGEI